MAQIIQLLYALGFAVSGLGYFIHSLTEIPWGAIFEWFNSAPVAPVAQMAPQLSLGNQTLYAQFQQLMEMQYQAGELRRIILTMPALPTEGF
jgi:hypothetical protein